MPEAALAPEDPSILVLNVDDYEAARYAKTRLLRNAGFLVKEACCGQEALDMTLALQPRLVLLDVKLPDIDGRDVCLRIRGNPLTRGIAIVHTSAACVTTGDVMRGYDSGADAYVTSPYTPDTLIALLRTFIR
jgi:CheY-like chemotaxis protein